MKLIRGKNRKNAKRVLSVVMIIVIMLCLLPLSGEKNVEASIYRTINLGTSGINGFDTSQSVGNRYDTIGLNGNRWNVLATEANGSVPFGGRTLFMLKNTTDKMVFSDNDTNASIFEWARSAIKQKAASMYESGTFTDIEKELILPTTKATDTKMTDSMVTVISKTAALNGDYLFLLSVEELTDGKYGFDNIVNRPAGTWSRSGFINSSMNVGNAYVLSVASGEVGKVIRSKTGNATDSGRCNYSMGMNIRGDVSSVLYSSGSKASVADNTEVPSTITGSRNRNWKLTLYDPSITLTKTGVAYDEANKKVTVEGIATNAGNVAVMITDGAYNAAGAALTNYGTLTTNTGSHVIKLPSTFDKDTQHVYLVPEKRGGTDETDLAGYPVELDVSANTVYTISTQADPITGGSSTESVTVKKGENATLTAAPQVGYRFLGWRKVGEAAYTATTPTMTITNVTENATYIADFVEASYEITIDASPENGGFVSGGGTVLSGGSATLVATPEENYSFLGWYKDGQPITGATSQNYTITGVDADAHYTAVFQKTKCVITLVTMPAGEGRSSIAQGSGSILGVSSKQSIVYDTINPKATVFYSAMRNKSDATPYKWGSFYKEDGSAASFNASSQGHINGNANEYYNYAGSSSFTFSRDESYIARWNYTADSTKDYTTGVATVVNPVGAGVTSGDKDGSITFTTKLTASANAGYVFDHWEWTASNKINTNKNSSFDFVCDGYYICTAYFRKATCEIGVAASPIEGGSVSGAGNYEYGSNATITATPYSGYSFSKWTWKDSAGKEQSSTEQNLQLLNIKESNLYTAVFTKNSYVVSVSATPYLLIDDKPVGTAAVQIGSVKTTTEKGKPSVSMEVASKGTAVLTATAAPVHTNSLSDQYKFKHWISNEGKTYTDNPLTVTDITADQSYTAVFEKATYNVTLKSSPATGGTTTFLDSSSNILQYGGTRKIEVGDSVMMNAEASLSNHYVFYRWEGSDGTLYYSANTTINNLREDVTYTAVFVKEDVEINVAATPTGKGTVKLEGSDVTVVTENQQYKVKATKNATMTATPSAGTNYKFVKWMDSTGKTYTDNPMQLINVTQNITYTAVFDIPKYTIKTVSNPIEGGTITGGGEFPAEGTTTLTATTETGYSFDHWSCSDGSSSQGTKVDDTTNTLTIASINGDATYTAHFVKQVVEVTINWTPDYVNRTGGSPEIYVSIDGAAEILLPATKKFTMSSSGSASVRVVPQSGYRVKQWLATDGTGKGDGILNLVNVKTDSVYTAEMEKGQYNITAKSSPIDGGITTVNGVVGKAAVDGGSNVELKAVPNTGYLFDHWSASDGTTASGVEETEGGKIINKLTINGVYGDETYTAHYIKSLIKITGYVSPAMFGTITYTVPGISGEKSLTNQSLDISPKVTFTLTAKASAGYKFKKWTLSDNTTSTSNPLTVSNLSSDMTFYAEFEAEGYNIKTNSSPIDGGTVEGGGNYAPGDPCTLIAKPETGYIFDYWSSNDGTTAAGVTGYDAANPTWNKLELGGVHGEGTYTAHFIKNTIVVDVSTSSNYGTGLLFYSLQSAGNLEQEFGPQGLGDRLSVTAGDSVTIRAKDAASYKFKQWVKQDNTVVSTNPLMLVNIKQDVTYIAEYEGIGYNIKTKSSPADGGTTDGGGSFSASNSGTTLHAYPDTGAGYLFVEWKDDAGNTYKDINLILDTISADATYTAYFKKGNDALTVLASPASGGKVSKTLNSDGSVTITATPNKGYFYRRWQQGSNILTTDTSYVVRNITSKATYTAYFEVDPNYSAKSGITDEKFLDAKRLYKDPLYKYTREGMTAYASKFVTGLAGQYADAAPGQKSWNAIAGAGVSEKESRNKNVEDFEGLLADNELITTDQEIMQVSGGDDMTAYEEEANKLTMAKFGERYTTTLLTVKEVRPMEGFVDGTKTLLWRGTGAVYKDNIYIIYSQGDYEPKMITGVVDTKGVIRFTVPSIGTMTRMAVVKVEIH